MKAKNNRAAPYDRYTREELLAIGQWAKERVKLRAAGNLTRYFALEPGVDRGRRVPPKKDRSDSS